MELKDLRIKLEDIKQEHGSKEIVLRLSSNEEPWVIINAISPGKYEVVRGDTFDELFTNTEKAAARLNKLEDDHIIEAMAKAVFEEYLAHGECTIGSLRSKGFNQHWIERVGQKAVDRVNKICQANPKIEPNVLTIRG